MTPSEPQQLIDKLWFGYVPLVKTYWVYGFVGSLILRILGLGLVAVASLISYHMGMFAVYVVVVIAILYGIFIMVAVWRSAGKYEGPMIWKYLARLAVIVGIILVVKDLMLS